MNEKNNNLEQNRIKLKLKLESLLNELKKNDIALDGKIYECTHYKNGRPCMVLDFEEFTWDEEISFEFYVDTMERV